MSSTPAFTRRRLSGAAATLPLPVLAACGPFGGGGKIARGTSSRDVTIRWSTWGDDKNAFNTEAVPKGLAVFKEQFPKLNVVAEPQVGGDWTVKNQTEWVAGSGPDMTGHCCYWGAQWARDGLFVNLSSKIKKDVPQRIQDDYVEWLVQFFTTPEQGQYALPMYSGTIALFYFKPAFQRQGLPLPDATWDWNRYRESALKLHDREPARSAGGERSNEVQSFTFGRRQVRGYDRIQQRLHQAGANYVDPKDDRRSVLDTPAALQALQYERDANLKDKYTGIEPEYEVTRGLDYFKALSAQRYAMWEEGSFALVRLATQIDRDAVPLWDVAPLPKGPKQRDTLATNDGWSIWKGSKAVDESWELVKFLQGDEWTELNSTITGQQPARKSFQERWVKLIKQGHPALADKNLTAFTDAIQQSYARPVEVFRKHRESLTIVDTLLHDAVYAAEVNPRVKNGDKAIDTAVADAVKRINELNR